MGSPQPQSPVQTYNMTAEGVVDATIVSNKLKSRTYTSTGYNTMKPKSNAGFTGTRDPTIVVTTVQNTTRQFII